MSRGGLYPVFSRILWELCISSRFLADLSPFIELIDISSKFTIKEFEGSYTDSLEFVGVKDVQAVSGTSYDGVYAD